MKLTFPIRVMDHLESGQGDFILLAHGTLLICDRKHTPNIPENMENKTAPSRNNTKDNFEIPKQQAETAEERQWRHLQFIEMQYSRCVAGVPK
jgi:hypothetical protein